MNTAVLVVEAGVRRRVGGWMRVMAEAMSVRRNAM